MSNSKLISYTKLTNNCNKPRGKEITKITPHHTAAINTVEELGNVFSGTRQVSANYGIGNDGRIGLYVDEANRAWTSSNEANDRQAVTIEVSNSGGAPDWKVGDKAFNSLIDLCVDICQRNPGIKQKNGKPGIYYDGTKDASLTLHKMFSATLCPGPYLESRIQDICDLVNGRLNGNTNDNSNTTEEMYRIRTDWNDPDTQIGAFKSLENAKKFLEENQYKIFDSKGERV